MNILLITDLYPVKETEKTTPKTLLNFVKEWEKQGHKVDVIKPNFILNSFLRGKPFYKTGKYGNVYNVNYWTPFWGKIEVARQLGSQAAKLDNSKILQVEQNDKFAYPPLGGGSKSLISGWGSNVTDINLSSCQPFNASIQNSTPTPTLPLGEGACHDSLSTLQPFNPSTETSLPSIILAHMPSGILFADKLGLPFVAGIHNSDLVVLTSPLYVIHFRKRMIKALKNAKAIACRSFVIKKKLLKLFPEFENKTFVAPSGIDNNIINLSTVQPFNHSTLKILTCAHFKKRKNIDKLIKACKSLENIELTVIGDGKIRKSLEKLDKNVIFAGELEPEKVLEKMRESDVFILPSVGETFGMVYLEAMASGCITVCTKDDGISGIIKDGENGFLTEPSVEDIKNTILRIKNLHQEELQKILQNTFDTIKEYTSEKVAQNYLQQIFNTI